MKYSYLIIILILSFSCTKQLTVDDVIDQSIEAYGGNKVLNSYIEFDFRDKHYSAKYHRAKFQLIRTYSDSSGLIVDESGRIAICSY